MTRTFADRLILKLMPLARRASQRLPKSLRRQALAALDQLDTVYQPSGAWFRYAAALDSRLLSSDGSRAAVEKMALFKATVRVVEFEPHAYCNRKCPFCSNVTYDRTGVKTAMADGFFRHALSELAVIGYDGLVRFARYCEPLACPETPRFVAEARAALPKSEIDIVSNGDYLNAELLESLARAGLSTLRISIYPNGYDWNPDEAARQMEKLAKRIGILPRQTFHVASRMSWAIPHDRIAIVAQAVDYGNLGVDRAQTVKSLVDRTYSRQTPCSAVFENLTIDYNGLVLPCCNMRSDVRVHQPNVLGDLGKGQSLFDIYNSPLMANWRASLHDVTTKGGFCATCKHKTLTSRLALAALKARIARSLSR